MSDREKVISNFEHKVNKVHGEGWSFFYLSIEDAKEILALLKEQEPKPVKVVKNVYNHEFYYCPRCDRSFHELLFGKPKFCDKCGQAVKWDD